MDCNNSHARYNSTDNSTSNCILISTTEAPWRDPPFDATVGNITLAIVLGVIIVVTFFGNLLVLVSFYVERRLLQPFNLFILNLAVTDFLVAFTAMTFYALDTLLGYWPFGRAWCAFWIFFDYGMTFASVFTLVAISADRFWCVTWAMHYKTHNNRNKTVVILIVIWICVLLIWTPPFIADRIRTKSSEHFCIWEPSENIEYGIFVAIVGHFSPCVIMVFCYIKVFIVMKRQAGRIAANKTLSRPMASNTASNVANTSQSAGNQENSNDNVLQIHPRNGLDKQEKGSSIVSSAGTSAAQSTEPDNQAVNTSYSRERRIFVTLTYVLSTYLICWVPFYIVFDTFAGQPDLVPSGVYTFFYWTSYFNSTLNPFVYAYTSKEFRQAFLKVMKKMYTCK